MLTATTTAVVVEARQENEAERLERRNRLIEQAMVNGVRAVGKLARKYTGVVPQEEIESLWGEVLVSAAEAYLRKGHTGEFVGYAVVALKNRLTTELRRRDRQPDHRALPLQGDTERGEHSLEEMLPDHGAVNPAEEAQERELQERRGRTSTTLAVAREVAPPVNEMPKWAQQLRAAMFNAISTENMARIMGALVKKAEGGDLKAISMVFDYVAGGKVTAHVRQTVVSKDDGGGGSSSRMTTRGEVIDQ